MLKNYRPTADLLANKVILVTGASQGIGRVIAKAYAAHGATVILLARSIKKLTSLYDEIENKNFPKPAIYPFNLATASPDDYLELKDKIESHFGRLDGIVHNAAALGTLTPIEHYPIDQWQQVLQVNVTSAFLLTQCLIPLLKKAKTAAVLFTLANEGMQGKAYWGAYAVSKFAVNGLMQTLADECEVNTAIRVNSINPGKVQTALRKAAFPGENTITIPNAESLVPLYLFLMSEESASIHGENVDAASYLRDILHKTNRNRVDIEVLT